jgi:hypothetical protein
MVAKLVLSLNGATQGEYPLEKERITIGRKPENDITVDNLAVSGKHALVITILDDSFLEDLGSTNGTYVNGKLIKKHALRHGDVISIGKHELKYINESATADDEELEKTMIIRPGSAAAAVEAAQRSGLKDMAPPPQSGAGSGMPHGKLNVLNGPNAGKELELTKALLTLGKPGVQVAVISRRPGGYFLTHIEGGPNNDQFPLVNGAPIGAQAYSMKDGDLIELAGIKMEFSLIK